MRKKQPKYSKDFGSYVVHPIEGGHNLEGRYLMATYEDIRKEMNIRPKLLDTYEEEFLWLVTQNQLDKLAEYWECEPFEKGFEVDAESVMGLLYRT